MSSLRFALPTALPAALFAAALPACAAEPPYPPRTLVLFVASWCAPCRAELKQLDPIAAVAVPLDVRVLPIDRSAATAAMLRDVPRARLWRSARALDAFAQTTAALPYSVMTDAAGRVCATHDRGLDLATVLAMRRRCDAAP